MYEYLSVSVVMLYITVCNVELHFITFII